MTRARALAVSLAMVGGCLSDSPQTFATSMGPDCAESAPGDGCLALWFSADAEVRADSPGDLFGDVGWALFDGGDLGLFGPGDDEAAFSGTMEAVDLSGGAMAVHVVSGIPAGSYQVVSHCDDDDSGDVDAGDPVTFPTEPFAVDPDVMTHVFVVFDRVR